MPDMRLPERIARLSGSWHADAVVAAVLGASLLGYAASQDALHGPNDLFQLACGLTACACVGIRGRYPKLAGLAAACCFGLTALGDNNVPPGNLFFIPLALIAYSLGTADDAVQAAAVLVVLYAGTQLATGITVFNPFNVVATAGAWALGFAVRSRRRVAGQLAARGRELEAERELFAAEAVRYERARIARELHDIVAHNISVMVIQAGAGQRLAGSDPAWSPRACRSVLRRSPGTRILSRGRRGRHGPGRTLGAPSLSEGAHDEIRKERPASKPAHSRPRRPGDGSVHDRRQPPHRPGRPRCRPSRSAR